MIFFKIVRAKYRGMEEATLKIEPSRTVNRGKPMKSAAEYV